MVKIMHSKEAYCTAIIGAFALKDEFAAILKKIDESAARGSLDCVWYTTNDKYMLVDEDRPVSFNDMVEKYTVDEFYDIIILILGEFGYDVNRKDNKLTISWNNTNFMERLIKNA